MTPNEAIRPGQRWVRKPRARRIVRGWPDVVVLTYTPGVWLIVRRASQPRVSLVHGEYAKLTVKTLRRCYRRVEDAPDA